MGEQEAVDNSITKLIQIMRSKTPKRLTAIRLRKMILDSGTPLVSSREIALTAEFPVNAQSVTSFS